MKGSNSSFTASRGCGTHIDYGTKMNPYDKSRESSIKKTADGGTGSISLSAGLRTRSGPKRGSGDGDLLLESTVKGRMRRREFRKENSW